MTHKLIKTYSYLIVVSDEEIKANDKYLTSDNRVVNWHQEFEDNIKENRPKPIKAHLPLNNSPILQGVDLLPELEQEDDVERLAEEEAKKLHNKSKHDDYDIYNQLVSEDKEMIKIGYNKAKEKYKWTDEDVVRIVEKSRETGLTAEYLMLSLSQPKMPIGFECEIEYIGFQEDGDFEEPKKYTNSQGQTVLVGRYIYE